MDRLVPGLARTGDPHHRPHAGARRSGSQVSDRLPQHRRIRVGSPRLGAGDRLCAHPPGERFHPGCPITGGRAWTDADHAAYRTCVDARNRPEVAQQESASCSRTQRGARNALHPITPFQDGGGITSWPPLPTTPVPIGSEAGFRPTARSRPRCGSTTSRSPRRAATCGRFLAYGAIYEHRLGRRPIRLSERMPPVPSRAAL